MDEQRKGREEGKVAETVKEILQAYDTLRLQMEQMNGLLADIKSLYEGMGRELQEVKKAIKEAEKENDDLASQVRFLKVQMEVTKKSLESGEAGEEEDYFEEIDEKVDPGEYEFGYDFDEPEDDDLPDDFDGDEPEMGSWDEEQDALDLEAMDIKEDPDWEKNEDPAGSRVCKSLIAQGQNKGLKYRNDASVDGNLWFWGDPLKMEELEEWSWSAFHLKGLKGTDKSLEYRIAWRPRLDLLGILKGRQLNRPLTLDAERYLIKEVKCGRAKGEKPQGKPPMVASVRFTNGHITRWLTNFEEDGYFNFLLTADDIYLRCTRNDVTDDGFMDYFNYCLVNTFEGIALGETQRLEKSVAEHAGSGAAILIKYLVALTNCREEDRNRLMELPRKAFLDAFYRENPEEEGSEGLDAARPREEAGTEVIEPVGDYAGHFLW